VQTIVDDLVRTGASITSLDALALGSTAAMLQASDDVIVRVRERGAPTPDGRKSSYLIEADAGDIEAHPDLLAWGLDPALLRAAELYFGAPVAYRGLTFRRDLADGQQIETRLWHIDGEDRRILKVIVYLNDVNEDNGPFEYVPRDKVPRGAPHALDNGRILDDEMERFVPRPAWKACTGKRGTAVLVDTHAVYHRGRVPRADRFALFFAYNSNRPVKPSHCQALFDRDRFAAMRPELSAFQRAAITYSY
jgi:hypothetical protein